MKQYLFFLLACATIPTMSMQQNIRRRKYRQNVNLTQKIKPILRQAQGDKKKNPKLHPQELAPLAILMACCGFSLFADLPEYDDPKSTSDNRSKKTN